MQLKLFTITCKTRRFWFWKRTEPIYVVAAHASLAKAALIKHQPNVDIESVFEAMPIDYPAGVVMGAGTELKKLLRRFWIYSTADCRCEERALIMDVNGMAWCRENINTIVGWMREEAVKRRLCAMLFSQIAATQLVRWAIRNAEKRSG
jgi:hypothetical protein